MSRIFVCYRREETEGYAGRVYDRLAAAFGQEAVFLDVGAIPLGVDFVEAVEEAVSEVDAVLVLIGRDWLGLQKQDGSRRIDDPNDFVRLEVATALARGVRVIPVLVGGARMPALAELPEDLKKLSRRQALELSHSRFDDDLTHLIGGLREILEEPVAAEAATAEEPQEQTAPPEAEPSPAPRAAEAPETPQPLGTPAGAAPRSKRRFWVVGLVVFVCLVGLVVVVGLGLFWVASQQGTQPRRQPSPVSRSQPSPSPPRSQPSTPETKVPQDVPASKTMLANALSGDDIIRIELVDVTAAKDAPWDWELRFKVHATYNSRHEYPHIATEVLPNIRGGYSYWGNFTYSPSGTTFQPRVLIDVQTSEVWSSAVRFKLWNRVGDKSEYYVERVYPLKRLWKRTRD